MRVESAPLAGGAMREIVLDTETTGLEPNDGHRIIEIGAVELFNHVPTGRVFHTYVNPGRDIPMDALRVHGLSAAFLAGQPPFGEVVDEFLAFLDHDSGAKPAPARLVIHNAEFDIAFLNMELRLLMRPPLDGGRLIVNTLQIARQRFPGAPNSLDALCRRFNVDGSARTRHGALLDAELLAEVYLGLMGGRQPDLGLVAAITAQRTTIVRRRILRPARPHAPSPEELAAHRAFLEQITQPIWLA
jgi:DNA polymerase III subunit epsilon